MSHVGGDLAPVDRALEDDAVGGRARLDERLLGGRGEFGVAGDHRHDARHDLELAFALSDRRRLDQRDQIAAQGSGVGRRARSRSVDFMQATASSTSSALEAHRR